MATGRILQECRPQHRQQEFLALLRRMERNVAPGLAIHIILDTYAMHKHPTVAAWLARYPRVQFHFTPTSASWLNLVERFFGELTQCQIRRLAVTSVAQLIAAITLHRPPQCPPDPVCLDRHRAPDSREVGRANATLATLH